MSATASSPSSTASPQGLLIHRHPLSGHCHRVELFCHLAGIPYSAVEVDLMAGEQRGEKFLRLNPFGKVPVLQDGEEVVVESCAILVYLARKYAPAWLPEDPALEAQIQTYLSLASGDLVRGPATARAIVVFQRPIDPQPSKEAAASLLALLEQILQARSWFVSEKPTIADVALYSYVAHAPEGNVPLTNYLNIQAWLKRLEKLPGFVPMTRSQVGLFASER